jgi:hypothetical protein
MTAKTKMGALDKFLEKLPDTFDPTKMFDPDVEGIENKFYDRSTIYKYFPSSRRAFFQKPQVRFSPREALNDPFEMSRRWREISTEGLRAYVRDKLNATLPAAFSNKELLASMLAEDLLEKGHVLPLDAVLICDECLVLARLRCGTGRAQQSLGATRNKASALPIVGCATRKNRLHLILRPITMIETRR